MRIIIEDESETDDECRYCNGHGYVECGVCEGHGYIVRKTVTDVFGFPVPYGGITHSRREPCINPRCRGGRVPCPICNNKY